MLDFSNLTHEQKEFFSEMWEQHQAQREQQQTKSDGVNAYLAKRRKLEDSQAAAAEQLKTLMK